METNRTLSAYTAATSSHSVQLHLPPSHLDADWRRERTNVNVQHRFYVARGEVAHLRRRLD